MKKKLLKNSFFYFVYKLLKILRNKKPSYHYGEFAEDVLIDRILKSIKNGVYIDVGCYHPIELSNTALLYNKGWNGMNIDLNQFKKNTDSKNDKEDNFAS